MKTIILIAVFAAKDADTRCHFVRIGVSMAGSPYLDRPARNRSGSRCGATSSGHCVFAVKVQLDTPKYCSTENQSIPYLMMKTKPKILSPLKAIRKHCLECVGGYRKEVKICTDTGCNLWPYRFGKSSAGLRFINR